MDANVLIGDALRIDQAARDHADTCDSIPSRRVIPD
jgi:hypothetical protein